MTLRCAWSLRLLLVVIAGMWAAILNTGCGGQPNVVITDAVSEYDATATNEPDEFFDPPVQVDASGVMSEGGPSTDAAATPDGVSEDVADASNADALTIDGSDGDTTGAVASDAPANDASENPLQQSCEIDLAPCMSGGNGLCRAGTCDSCTDVVDDLNCNVAYRTTGRPYMCIGEACVPGNCHSDADCSGGQVCGIATPNFCGHCSSDAHCKTLDANGNSTICDTTTGGCVTATCSNPGTACTGNAGDICCPTTHSIQACVPGNCCQNSDCAAMGTNYVCTNHTCSACALAAGDVYYVDPANGSDTSATGSGTTSGGSASNACAFRTITRALRFLGPTPPLGTRIVVRNTRAVSTGESFPIVVTAGVTVTGAAGAVASVRVPADRSGFVLATPDSQLAYLTIDGSSDNAQHGIVAQTGSSTATAISNLTVRDFASDGILVRANGILTIGEGVTSTENGTTEARANGLYIRERGQVTIDNPSGAQIAFSHNTAHGILVDGLGSIRITATPGVEGTGTVVANDNSGTGLWIAQRAIPPTVPPLNSVNGLVTYSEVNGIRILAGSNVVIRNAYSLRHISNGIFVTTNVINRMRVNDVSHIDLGTASDFGHNVLQTLTGQSPNLGAGLCLMLDSTPTPNFLSAAGNVFAGSRDCSTPSPEAITIRATCHGKVNVGIAPTGRGEGLDPAVNIANCVE